METASFNDNPPLNYVLQELYAVYASLAFLFSIECSDTSIYKLEKFA